MFIFSVDRIEDSEIEKMSKREDIEMFLSTMLGPECGLWEKALGRYTDKDGNTSLEVSFVVYNDDLSLIDGAIFGPVYRQESILIVDETHKAFLLFANGSKELLGTWHKINGDAEIIRLPENYTVIGNDYYVAVKDSSQYIEKTLELSVKKGA